MKARDVAVTGVGVVTPIGVGKDRFWHNAFSGVSGIKPITSFEPADEPIKYAAVVNPEDFAPKRYLTRPKQIKFLNRHAQFAMAAAKMAVDDAKLSEAIIDPNRLGVYLGTLFGQPASRDDVDMIFASESEHTQGTMDTVKYGRYLATHINPIDTLKNITNLIACHIAIALDARGPVNTFIADCISGAQAIGSAFRAIQQADADIIIAGGAEASIFRQCLLDYFLLHPAAAAGDSLTMESCRPFDARRKGFVPGEGAGMVVLECLEAARRRNAKIYGQLKGYGISNACWQNDEREQISSVARSMEKALAVAGIEAAAVDYINANGDSTIQGDKLETMAIKKVFGDHAYQVPISSTKSMTGHLLSASGAVELVAALLAMQDNIIPPTINYRYPDPECDLDYVPNHSRKHGINVVLSNSISWFGPSAGLVVQKYVA